MPRPTNTQERQAQIIGGLIKVMAKRGYDGASIADIARAARLSPGLVHYHFKSKQEILLAALHALAARHAQRLTARLQEAGDDPAAEVVAFIELHLGLGADADREALSCWVLLAGEALRDSRVRGEYEKVITALVARLGEIIERGIARRVFACASAAAAASALFSAVQGYFVLAATTRSVIPAGSAAPATRLMAEGLLRPSQRLRARAELR